MTYLAGGEKVKARMGTSGERGKESEALTESYVQKVPDKCDRIIWRNRYYHLPTLIPSDSQTVNERADLSDSPLPASPKKVLTREQIEAIDALAAQRIGSDFLVALVNAWPSLRDMALQREEAVRLLRESYDLLDRYGVWADPFQDEINASLERQKAFLATIDRSGA